LCGLGLRRSSAAQQLVQLIGQVGDGVDAQCHAACECAADGFRYRHTRLPKPSQIRDRLRLKKAKVDEYDTSPGLNLKTAVASVQTG